MISTIDYVRLLPEIVLTVFGILLMLIEPLTNPRGNRHLIAALSFVGAVLAVGASFAQLAPGIRGPAFFDLVHVDTFSIFFHVVICSIAAVVILASNDYLEAQEIRAGEYYALVLFGTVGMALMSSAVELVLIFVALEISSISTYILAGWRRRAAASAEASLKYFLLGSFATAFFLYGVALIFGATKSTNIYQIAETIKAGQAVPSLVWVATALMFVGMAFKVAAAPFHVWTPDVYEGAPAPVVALMSTAPKAAVFAIMLRILLTAVMSVSQGWFWLVWVAAVLSMCIGNIGALVQNNVKRLLAYSSIAHAGYLLVAIAATVYIGDRGISLSAAMFYTAAYAAMNVGAFLLASHFAGHGERRVTLDDYAGLGRRSPMLAALLTVFLLSLIGIPATGGFFAKFYVFSAALKANLVGLTIIGLINSGVAAYYYLKIMVVMYMREPAGMEAEGTAVEPLPAAVGVALFVSAALTLYLGILPGHILQYAAQSASDIFLK
jgi:NADH-quinone oxidoreductase subunit N